MESLGGLTVLGVAALGASCGLRVFLAPFVCCLLAALGAVEVPSTSWIGSSASVGLAALFLLVEVGGDKLPGVDQALDAAGLVLRPAWGVGVVLALVQGAPAIGACLFAAAGALILGLGKARLRAESRDLFAETQGRSAVRPMLSLLEDVATSVGVLGAVIWGPLGLGVLALVAVSLHLAAWLARRRRAQLWLAAA